MKDIMLDFTQNIVALDLVISGKEKNFFTPSLRFKCLRSLTLKSYTEYGESGQHENISYIIEVIITNHAEKLEELKVEGYGIIDLNVPVLDQLDFLSMTEIRCEVAFKLLRSCLNNITCLNLERTSWEYLPLIHANLTNPETFYSAPKFLF